jgi:short-subunit dehydrogenase
MSGNQVAIVTGASSGIGAALAKELHGRGMSVGLIARREAPMQALVQELGDRAAYAIADVVDREGLRTAVKQLEEQLGACSLLIANAGIGGPTSAKRWEPKTADTILRIMDVNYRGVVHAVDAVLPGMLSRGSGQLSVVSSVAGYRGLPMFGGYSSSKAAVTNLFEALRIELEPKGIVVSTIHPGFIETPLVEDNQFSMPFLIQADKAARIMATGLERGRSEINLPWQMATLMGIIKHLPVWLWDWLVSRARPS